MVIKAIAEEDHLYRVLKKQKQYNIYDCQQLEFQEGVEERTTPAQRPALSSLHLHTIAGEAKIELTEPKEPKEPYAKQLE